MTERHEESFKLMRQVEGELLKKEAEAIAYWKGELEKLLVKRPESLGTLQMELKGLVQRMQNRIRVIKNTLTA